MFRISGLPGRPVTGRSAPSSVWIARPTDARARLGPLMRGLMRIPAIRSSGADVVAMQETYGSGAVIADALGYHLYLRSTNLAVMSRYPMGRSFDLYEPPQQMNPLHR